MHEKKKNLKWFILLLLFVFIASGFFLFTKNETVARWFRGVDGRVSSTPRASVSSFSDLFSGMGWINTGETTLYHDYNLTAFSFEPKYQWTQILAPSVSPTSFLLLHEEGKEKQCIRNSCFERKEKELFLDGKKISLPREIYGKKIETISLGILDTVWVVGIVEEESGSYLGWVFLFDGNTYTSVSDSSSVPLFQSKYSGTIGVGGVKKDFIAVYGGYEGQAYHIRGKEKHENISKFFGTRGMGVGLVPAVTRVSDGATVRWYVYSLTDKKPILLKLFSDEETGDIAGGTDFGSLFLDGKVSSALFVLKEVQGDKTILEAKIGSNFGGEEYWEFADEGYIIPKNPIVSSLNLNGGPGEIESATLVELELFEGRSDGRILLSNDGKNWFEAHLGKLVIFPDMHGKKLFWKSEFTPQEGAKFYPPYLTKIRVDYKIKTF